MILSSSLPSLESPTIFPCRMPTLARRIWSDPIRSSLRGTRNPRPVYLNSSIGNSNYVLYHSHSSSPVQLGLRRNPELFLASILFVMSMALVSFISLALVSLPVLIPFRKLAISMDKLSKVASEEVPGTLSSLKLSGLEINDLTSPLKYMSFIYLPLDDLETAASKWRNVYQTLISAVSGKLVYNVGFDKKDPITEEEPVCLLATMADGAHDILALKTYSSNIVGECNLFGTYEWDLKGFNISRALSDTLGHDVIDIAILAYHIAMELLRNMTKKP